MNETTKATARWLLPFPIQASGGHRTIYTHMERMVADGFCCVACVDMRDVLSPFSSRRARIREVQSLLASRGIRVILGHEAIFGPADIAVATSWRTAFAVAMSNASHKAYFIQDYEPWFFPHGDYYLKAEQSYRLGLTPIVLGRWLAGKVGKLSDQAPFVLPFTVDRQIYAPTNAPAQRVKAICYVHQPEKPRRCTALAQVALGIVKKRRPEIAIWSYGSPRAPELAAEHFGVLSGEACARLYNKAAVGLCISASNPSRIPFEMAACGLPVVDIDSENTREDALPAAFLLTPPDPSSLADALIAAVDQEQFRDLVLPVTPEDHFRSSSPDELDASSHAFRQILQEPPVLPAWAGMWEGESGRFRDSWPRLRSRLGKAYVAFWES